MNTKLTLRLDERLIARAKIASGKRGKSVSQMVGEYFDSLENPPTATMPHPPITGRLLGALRGSSVDEKDYRRHLLRKHL